MKRTQNIQLSKLRKAQDYITNKPLAAVKPLTLAVAAVLAGCGQKQETVQFVTSVSDCTNNTSLSMAECEVAYKKALAEAERTGPKYRHRYECETEFGDNACQRTSSGFFTPFMTGFLVSSLINNNSFFNPVYSYSSPYSSYRNRLILSDGTVVGRPGSRSYSLPEGTANKKMPTAKKTVSRGGFGSSAQAKSTWGSSRSGGWGG